MAALMLAPFSPAFIMTANARTALAQQEDIPSDAEQAMFTKGQNLYNQGRYDQAVTVLQDFLKTYPRSIITDLTLLWLGRSYMQLGKIKDAEQVGQRLHTIKDTPFADIYDCELETARAERGTRTTTPQGGTMVKVPEARPTPTKPMARKIPDAVPTPTPAPRIVSNTGARPAQTQTATGIKPPTLQINNGRSGVASKSNTS